MARIDTSKISGYADMTLEEKVKALEAMRVPDEVDMTKFVSKDMYDKASHDIASLKQKLKDRMDDDERKKAEDKERYDEMEKKYNELMKESTIAKHKAKYIAMGYEESMAESTATAIVDGDMDTVFANQKKFTESLEQKIRKETLGDTPRPKSTDNDKNSTMTLEKLRKMSPQERFIYQRDHQQEYERLYGRTDE